MGSGEERVGFMLTPLGLDARGRSPGPWGEGNDGDWSPGLRVSALG